jgi:ATP-dependent protease ClpP protease subunit
MHMSKRWLPLILFALVAGCRPPPADEDGSAGISRTATEGASTETVMSSEREDFGATVIEMPTPPDEPRVEPDPYEEVTQEVDWTPMSLESGQAFVGCDHDYAEKGDGEPLVSLGFSTMWKAMKSCRDADVVRLRYQGKVSADFTALVKRVADMADTLGIERRILDIDSSGGQVEEGIRAGDAMAEADWMVWVREDAVCHSSCVLILAAGDMRMIAGPVGVHRMLRIGSKATSRAELNQELRDVHEQMSQYLQRNGAATSIADLMTTVPNRSLRLLTAEELERFGLSGRNAAEDDLERIRLGRKCGEAFIRRKDAFFRDYDLLCISPGEEVADMSVCGRRLKDRYKFPDKKCPAESPMPEYD